MAYKFDTFVNRQEADALKEMIFRRVRERAEVMSEEVQTDVMDMARSSFVSDNNPFSKIINKPVNEESSVQEAEKQEIGFPQKESGQRLASQSRLIKEQIESAAVASTMQEARVGLSNKSGFMGALNFLNSQAALSLIKTRADKFEMLA